MDKKIIVNYDAKQTRVAVLEDGKPVELYVERPVQQRVVGNIYKGVVENVLPGMQAAFVNIGQERNAFLYVDDILVEEDDQENGEDLRSPRPIQSLLAVGKEVMVQVVKEPFGNKGARLTSQITLPGRFLVLVPGGDQVGISRRIEAKNERERLKKIAEEIRPRGIGLIVRTVAE
ncbi:MAG: ribonuclease G, partial [Firmicutes bacterium]|nr:ribonuclease G [Bacillota bacterium]